MFATIGMSEAAINRRNQLLDAKREREKKAREDKWANEMADLRRAIARAEELPARVAA